MRFFQAFRRRSAPETQSDLVRSSSVSRNEVADAAGDSNVVSSTTTAVKSKDGGRRLTRFLRRIKSLNKDGRKDDKLPVMRPDLMMMAPDDDGDDDDDEKPRIKQVEHVTEDPQVVLHSGVSIKTPDLPASDNNDGSCFIADNNNEEETTTRNGAYFIQVMEKETRRIEVLVDEVQQDLTSGTVPEETCGCLRAAVGKARLLRDQKFAQFRSLCDKNLKPSESEEKVLAGDLAGFWDLVWIQIDEINRTFAEIQELKSNNWQTRPEPESLQGHHHGFSETDTLLPLSSSATTAAGASNNSSSRPAKKANNNKTGEAASKRIQRQERASLSTASAAAGVSDVADERRKRMLEFKRKMKKAHHQLEEENGGQEVADIVFFEGLSDKQKLRT